MQIKAALVATLLCATFSSRVIAATIESKPSSASFDFLRRSRAHGRSCFASIKVSAFRVAVESCRQAADDFKYAAFHMTGSEATPSDVATLLIVSSLYRKAQSLALLKSGDYDASVDAFNRGSDILHALSVTPGCRWCKKEAISALKRYGEWSPHDYVV